MTSWRPRKWRSRLPCVPHRCSNKCQFSAGQTSSTGRRRRRRAEDVEHGSVLVCYHRSMRRGVLGMVIATAIGGRFAAAESPHPQRQLLVEGAAGGGAIMSFDPFDKTAVLSF